MSSKYDEYHRTADDCLQMALTASTDAYRVSWLKLAQAWLQMIPADQLKIAEWAYEDIVRAKATHGPNSSSSH